MAENSAQINDNGITGTEIFPQKSKVVESLISTQNSDEIRKEFVELFNQNLNSQPESTFAYIKEYGFSEEFSKNIKKIDGKIWLFSDARQDQVLALVNSDEHPEIFRPRFFRVSNSDHQYKVHPGSRENKSELMKGRESSYNHHYVQSNKLHPDLLNILETLPKSKAENINMLLFLPQIISHNPYKVSHPEDFTFSEKQIDIKDKDWVMFKRLMMENYDIYSDIITSVDHNVDQLYELVKKIKDSTLKKMEIIDEQDFILLEQSYQNLSLEDKTRTFRYLKNSKTSSTVEKSFVDNIGTLFSNTIEKMMTFDGKLDVVMEKTHFVPDFSQPPVRSYQLSDSEIFIEEYDQISSNGDHLRWAMARDKKGRVFINNIYDPTVGIDDYGTPQQKANFGLLVYKTEDYPVQTMFIKSKYVRDPPGDYYDISLLMERQYPIRKYKQALENRKAA